MGALNVLQDYPAVARALIAMEDGDVVTGVGGGSLPGALAVLQATLRDPGCRRRGPADPCPLTILRGGSQNRYFLRCGGEIVFRQKRNPGAARRAHLLGFEIAAV